MITGTPLSRRRRRHSSRQAGVSIAHDLDAGIVLPQVLGRPVGEAGVVFDDQDAHPRIVPRHARDGAPAHLNRR
jgi:hypothetical protein